MIVQIYSLTTADDVTACVEAGVDHVGVAAGDQDLPASISNEHARSLFESAPPGTTTVALSVHTEVDRIVEYARDVRPDVLHLCPSVDDVGLEAVRDVRSRLPAGMDLMRAIDVGEAEPTDVDQAGAIDVAVELDPLCDWFLLDTATDAVRGIGASGETHDWGVSSRLVDVVETPVVLAGGLSPENVAEAVRTVDPAGVDSYTLTSRTERRKDPERVRAFVENAREAAPEP